MRVVAAGSERVTRQGFKVWIALLCALAWLAGCEAAAPLPVEDVEGADTAPEGSDAAAQTDAAQEETKADALPAGSDAEATCAEPCVDTDNNPCTYQVCEAGACVAKQAADGSACEDGDPCTAKAACTAGVCKADPSPDNNLCPCQNNADCASLDDGLACNGTFFCDQSSFPPACKVNPASIPPCEAQLPPSPCLTASCEEPATPGGKPACAWKPLADGTPCSDNNAQTEGDACKSGVCLPGEFVGNCQSNADCAQYEDGNACNGKLFCNKAKAQCQVNPASVVSCPTVDDTLCRKNECQPATGQCVLTPRADNQPCDDGNPCTAGEVCGAGSCGSATNICTCSSDADCAGKDDGNLCNGTLYCNLQTGTCALNPATVVTCGASNNPCTQLACVPQTGVCEAQPLPDGTPCNADNSLCTLADACMAGSCEAGENLCKCATSADCAVYDDGNLCNGQLFCNQQTGTCALNPATVVDCVDALPGDCTAIACEPETGACVPQPVAAGAPCEDGVACTLNQACDAAGQCSGGFFGCGCAADWDCASVDDGNPCNGKVICDLTALPFPTCANQAPPPCAPASPCELAACDPKTGACQLSQAPTGATCDDGDGCTAGETCGEDGSCKGTALICDDNQPCTTDLCAGGGCIHVPQPNGTACDDANPCTLADACTEATCVGLPLGCDDRSPCTLDVCDPDAGGCVFTPVEGACDDGDSCTTGDTCVVEQCLGEPVVCDDGDPCTVEEVCTPEGCIALAQLPCDDDDACTTNQPCQPGVGCVAPVADGGASVYWSQTVNMDSFGAQLLVAGPDDPTKGTVQWAEIGYGPGADPIVRMWGLPGEEAYTIELGFPGSTHAFAAAWDGSGYLIGGQSGYGVSYAEQAVKPYLARVSPKGQIVWQDNQFRPGAVVRGLQTRHDAAGRVMVAGTVDAGAQESDGKIWLAEVDVAGPAPVVVRETTCTTAKGGALAAGLSRLADGRWAVSGRVKPGFVTAGQPSLRPIACIFDDDFALPPQVILPEVSGVSALNLLERASGDYVMTLQPSGFFDEGQGGQLSSWSVLLLSKEGSVLSATSIGFGSTVVGLAGDLLVLQRDVANITHVFGLPLGAKEATPVVLWNAGQESTGRGVVADATGFAILTEGAVDPQTEQQTKTLTHVDGRWTTSCSTRQLCESNCAENGECAYVRCKELGCAAEPFVCDDGNPCTLDLCGQGGCVQKVAEGEPCDDGRLCTVSDTCKGGSCTGTSRLGTQSQIVDSTERIRGAVAHGDGLFVVGERLQGTEAQVFWRKYGPAGVQVATGIVRSEPISASVPQVMGLAKFALTYSTGGGFPDKLAPAVAVSAGDGYKWLYTVDPKTGDITPLMTLTVSTLDRNYGLLQYDNQQIDVLKSENQGELRIFRITGPGALAELVSWDLGVYQPRALLPLPNGLAVVSEDASSRAKLRVDLLTAQGDQITYPAFADVAPPSAIGQTLIKGVHLQDKYILIAHGDSGLSLLTLQPDPNAAQYSLTTLSDPMTKPELPGAFRASRKGGGAIARQSEGGWELGVFDGIANQVFLSSFVADEVVGLALTAEDVWVVTEEAGGSKRDVRVIHLDYYGYSACETGLTADCFGVVCDDGAVCTTNTCWAGSCQYNSLENAGLCGTAGICTQQDCPVPFACQQCSAEATCDLFAQTCTCNAGFEGNGFACADIDECTEGLSECTPPTVCQNTYGGYSCL